MAKPSIYTANTNDIAVGTNEALPLGNIVRRPRNRNLSLSGSSILISDPYENYYDVTVSVTFTGQEVGDAQIVLQENGNVIPGTQTGTSISTADTVVESLSFSCTIRSTCGCNIDQLQIVNTGIPLTFSNIAMKVIKN